MIDAECQRGLQQLRELLSHVDPHLTVGQLVGRLVREGVERYDPDGRRQIALRLWWRTRPGREVRGADGSRNFAGRLASRRKRWGSFAQ